MAAFSATVYKWVDENGVVHYSDQPHENAEKVQVAAPQTYSAPRTARQGPQAPALPSRPPNVYQSCAIIYPQDQQNLQNTDSVQATVQVSPAPHDGDRVALMFDGTPVAGFPPTGGTYTISPVDRGEHSLQAVVQDTSGKVLCTSANVMFSITQPSVLNPANPNFNSGANPKVRPH